MVSFLHLTLLLQLITISIGLLLMETCKSIDYKIVIATGIMLQFSVSTGFILATVF